MKINIKYVIKMCHYIQKNRPCTFLSTMPNEFGGYSVSHIFFSKFSSREGEEIKYDDHTKITGKLKEIVDEDISSW